MGLPEETIESFKNNWEILASIHPQPTIMAWNCSVFVNAPMNNPSYKEKYGIEVFKSPMFMQHSSKTKREIKEFEKMIRGTNSLPNGQIREIYLYNWIMMVFNSFSILREISRFYKREYSLSHTKFYEYLIEYCKNSDGIFSKEYEIARIHAENGYSGKGWGHYDDELGDISWPIEEASWLRLTRKKVILEREIEKFLQFVDSELNITTNREDLIKFQIFTLNFPEDRSKPLLQEDFENDWATYFNTNVEIPIEEKKTKLSKITKVNQDNLIKWGYESIWFGRRSMRYKTKPKEMIRNDA